MTDDNTRMNPGSLEALWIEEKLKRYRTAGVGLLLWAIFVAEVMEKGRYRRPYLFFACSGIAVLPTVAGLGVQRYRRQSLFATFGMHLSLWAPCLYLGGG